MMIQNHIQRKVITALLITRILFVAPLFAEPFSGLSPLSLPDTLFSSKKMVDVSATVDPDKAKLGSTFRLYLRVSIASGSHIYSLEEQLDENLASRIELKSSEFLPDEDWRESPPQIALDDVFKRALKIHGDFAEFSRTYQIPYTLKPGEFLIDGVFVYRLCNNKTCSLPQSLNFQVPIKLVQKEVN